MNRRSVIRCLLALPIVLTVGAARATARTRDDIARMREGWAEWLPSSFTPPDASQAFALTDKEWRQQLSTAAFGVLREEGTEYPYTSPLNDEERDGVFVCAGCDLPLFSSAMKYDSRTGWPSFVTHIPSALGTKRDFKLIWPRTEYHCARCGGHHGHLFDDGPPPTYERWCNNGVALRFLPSGQ